ncbi:MAG: hypothetical protein ACR2JI_09175, partial [Mycobacterium sp.]
MTNLVQQALTSFIGDLISGASVDALVPQAALTPEITAVPQAQVPVAEPPLMTAQPDALSVTATDPLAGLGGGSGDVPLASPLAWAAVAASRQDPAAATPEVAPAATVTTGEPVDPATAAEVAAATIQPYPDLPQPVAKCKTASYLTCKELDTYRPTIVNNISKAFADAFNIPVTDQDKCDKSGCPESVSNTVGMYGFNVVYALMGDLSDDMVAATVQQLASQPTVLSFISQTVTQKFSKLPENVAILIGNAAATFVSKSFGNPVGPSGQANYVALQFVPFLKALNFPTAFVKASNFLLALKNGNPNNEILKMFDPQQGQKALINFFSTEGVQTALGNAFTDSIKVLLVPTLANYIGQQAATGILGTDSPYSLALGATIGGAVSGLFSSIGGIVATQAGVAFGAFLRAPGQDVPTKLANTLDNDFVRFLIGTNPNPAKPIPYPDQPDLFPSLAPAAGFAVAGFANAVLTNPTVRPALGSFVSALIPGMLANPGVQQVVSR